MLKAITFDVGGVLAKGGLNKRKYEQGLLDLLESHGQRVSRAELKKAVGSAMAVMNRVREKNLEMDFFEFRRLILLRLGVTPTESLLEGMLKLYYECFENEPVPGCKEVLDLLSKKYLLGIISNTMSLASKHFVQQNSLSSYFKVQLYSGEIGIRKPDPRIFQMAVQALGVVPSETVHIGDLPEEDLGAKRIGMKVILVNADVPEADACVSSLWELPDVIAKLDKNTTTHLSSQAEGPTSTDKKLS